MIRSLTYPGGYVSVIMAPVGTVVAWRRCTEAEEKKTRILPMAAASKASFALTAVEMD